MGAKELSCVRDERDRPKNLLEHPPMSLSDTPQGPLHWPGCLLTLLNNCAHLHRLWAGLVKARKGKPLSRDSVAHKPDACARALTSQEEA